MSKNNRLIGLLIQDRKTGHKRYVCKNCVEHLTSEESIDAENPEVLEPHQDRYECDVCGALLKRCKGGLIEEKVRAEIAALRLSSLEPMAHGALDSGASFEQLEQCVASYVQEARAAYKEAKDALIMTETHATAIQAIVRAAAAEDREDEPEQQKGWLPFAFAWPGLPT